MYYLDFLSISLYKMSSLKTIGKTNECIQGELANPTKAIAQFSWITNANIISVNFVDDMRAWSSRDINNLYYLSVREKKYSNLSAFGAMKLLL